MVSPGDYIKRAAIFLFTKPSNMKKLLQYLGLADPDPPVFKHVQRKNYHADVDMEAFGKWCKELNVSRMARSSEFTVMIGNHVKVVSLDRF
jgi:hypothetical protein